MAAPQSEPHAHPRPKELAVSVGPLGLNNIVISTGSTIMVTTGSILVTPGRIILLCTGSTTMVTTGSILVTPGSTNAFVKLI
ncbi:hypothetical protein Tco_0332569 [Tanacetum coccineum]